MNRSLESTIWIALSFTEQRLEDDRVRVDVTPTDPSGFKSCLKSA